MNATVACPGCGGTHVQTQKIHINRKTGDKLEPRKWIGAGVGLLVMVCLWVPLFTRMMANNSSTNMAFIMLNAVVVIGGLGGGVYVLARYRGSPTALELVCPDCAHRWRSEEAVKVLKVETARQVGNVYLSFLALPPATYTAKGLELVIPGSCVYCSAPGEEPVPIKIAHTEKIDDKKSNVWSFDFPLLYCKTHAELSRRNTKLLHNLTTIGMMIGGGITLVLTGIVYFSDPEGITLGVFKFLSYFLPEYWMALIIAFLIPIGIISLGGILGGVFLVGSLQPIFSRSNKSLHDQHTALGVNHTFTTEKELVLGFTRIEYAEAFRALNTTKLQSLADWGAAEAAQKAWEALPEMVKETVTVEAELEKAGAVCWFCQKGAPADGTPYNIVYFKMDGKNRTEQTLWVPRCKDCENYHHRSSSKSAILGQVFGWSLLGVCVLIGLAGRGSAWGWVIGAVVASLSFIVLIVLMQRRSLKHAEAAGTRDEATANTQFTGTAELLADKWTLDAAKTGKAKLQPAG
jgi:hypothetical protein